MDDATLATGDAGPMIRLERVLRRPPAEVWRALTDRRELGSWFPCDILTAEWKIGASLRFVFPQGEADDLTGTVIECDEPNTLAFTWGDEILRFELAPFDGGTRLVLTDELGAAWAARNAAGWDVCLEHLEGRTTPPTLWSSRFDRYVDRFMPVLGPQEGPPAPPHR
jgi:uncharacterized protein YndB with AHSA1/START domain